MRSKPSLETAAIQKPPTSQLAVKSSVEPNISKKDE